MRIMFTGGAACGKSSFAERLVDVLPQPYYYIATMVAYGPDGAAKVAKHRRMRAGRPFTTIECPRDISKLEFPVRGTVLFEDITNLVANEMFGEDGFDFEVTDRIVADFEGLFTKVDDIIIVTNEVGCDLYDYTPETRAYIETMGAVNAAIAQRCDAVYEFVGSLPLKIKAPAPLPEALEIAMGKTSRYGGAA